MNFPSVSSLMFSFGNYLTRFGKRYGWLSLLFWIFWLSPSQAVELRVAISKNTGQVKVGSSTTALIKDGSGRNLGEIAPMNAFLAKPTGSNVSVDRWQATELWIEPSGDGYVWIGDRWYRGRTRLVRNAKGVMAVNYVDIEDYLYSVVGAEAIPSWPIEALKTQAVAARTYALYKRAEASNKLYDVDTTTGTQVYKGLNSEYTTTHEAVNGTKGEVLMYNGKAILAVFHSSSGGHTENVEDVWMQKLPYLRGVQDYDQQAPVYQWSKSLSAGQMKSLITGVGNINSLVPQKKTPQGRIVSMRVIGDRGSKVVSGDTLRQALDLRSTLFSVSAGNGKFEIYGKGFGHGIGLSQWGANFLAQGGNNYRQILGHYYQNSQLARIQ